jgi:hypothetical protein
MPYTVQFVGLVCFYREKGGRQALLPDGRNPGAGIDPHFASIIVAPGAVETAIGWNGDSATTGTFSLPPSTVTLEGVDRAGRLDTSGHDDRLPQLRRLDPNFEIDPDRADTIARLHIRQGKLTAYRIRGGEAAISQLDVPHDGPIKITVTLRDGSPERTIVLQPGTEVAVTNTAGKSVYDAETADQENGHFRIYERLSVRPVSLAAPVTAQSKLLPESPSHHAMFVRPRAINLTINCSNTGCC